MVKRDDTGKFKKEQGYLFSRIAKNMPVSYEKDLSKEARDWFRDSALGISYANPRKLFENEDSILINTVNESMIGKPVMFWYDAKWKDKLPYWDKLPISFPIEMYKDGFLGINLHYLPPLARAKLMDALYGTINTKTLNEKSKLNITYNILKGASKFQAFKPCIKRYLFSHVQSRFLTITPQKWDVMLFLPLARWQKSSQEQVWRDSMNKIANRTSKKK